MRFRILIKDVPLLKLAREMPMFLINYGKIRKQALVAATMPFPFGKLYPCPFEDSTTSGTASGHYFHQDLLVAGKVFRNHPTRHVDIGSRVDGFVAHVASFREIEVFDVRELAGHIQNIRYRRLDLMDRDFPLTDYCDSISCLHALEHFGLGRYGDRIEYNGHLQGWKNIRKMLLQGGKLYFSVPIGPQRIEFNAHRVFSLAYLLRMIEVDYRIDSFSYVNDNGDLFMDVPLEEGAVRNNFSCDYGCGIFELTKA